MRDGLVATVLPGRLPIRRAHWRACRVSLSIPRWPVRPSG